MLDILKNSESLSSIYLVRQMQICPSTPVCTEKSPGSVPISLIPLGDIIQTLNLFSSTSSSQRLFLHTGVFHSICSKDWLRNSKFGLFKKVELPAITFPFRFAQHLVCACTVSRSPQQSAIFTVKCSCLSSLCMVFLRREFRFCMTIRIKASIVLTIFSEKSTPVTFASP